MYDLVLGKKKKTDERARERRSVCRHSSPANENRSQRQKEAATTAISVVAALICSACFIPWPSHAASEVRSCRC